uniref:ISXO2-like transposase domain-containing protein n=1 Tax=Ditylenchus dipsaci TaxID=166011 RepID=A0A915DYK7_9BILA
MVRVSLIASIAQSADVLSLRLYDCFQFSDEQTLELFVGIGLLRNQATCNNCGKLMAIEKRKERIDGLQWRCVKGRKLCSRKSIRHKSFFSSSHIRLKTWLIIFYMWANDYSNQQIVKETGISADTICHCLNLCREICQNYCHNQHQLGGPDKFIEIDEASICKRKYNRGRFRRGASQWVFGGIERGAGGLAFAIRVKDRKKKTLLRLIRKHIIPGTTIISDEWPAYRKLVFRGNYMHILAQEM